MTHSTPENQHKTDKSRTAAQRAKFAQNEVDCADIKTKEPPMNDRPDRNILAGFFPDPTAKPRRKQPHQQQRRHREVRELEAAGFYVEKEGSKWIVGNNELGGGSGEYDTLGDVAANAQSLLDQLAEHRRN